MYKDFKIGNYTQIENKKYYPLYSDEIFEVTKIDKISLGLESALNDDDIFYINQKYKFIKPIKLTEDWILKLGFKLDYRTGEFENMYSNDLITIHFNYKYNFVDFDNVLLAPNVKIKFVHELQNLCSILNIELSL